MKKAFKIAIGLGPILLGAALFAYFLLNFQPTPVPVINGTATLPQAKDEQLAGVATTPASDTREAMLAPVVEVVGPIETAQISAAAPSSGAQQQQQQFEEAKVQASASSSAGGETSITLQTPTSPQPTVVSNTQAANTPAANTQTSNTQTSNTQTSSTLTSLTQADSAQAANTQTANTQTANTQTANTQTNGQSEPEVRQQQVTLSPFELYVKTSKAPIDFYDITETERRQWDEFKNSFRKNYNSEQEQLRRQEIFLGNLRFIETFNKLPGNSFKLGMNRFGDLEFDEINQLFIGPRTKWAHTIGQRRSSAPLSIKILAPDSGAQSSVDWRPLLVEPGWPPARCPLESSVYAAVASMEARAQQQHQLAAQAGARPSEPVKLSDEQVIDCLVAQRQPVCWGNLSMWNVFELLQNNPIRLATSSEHWYLREARKENDGLLCDIGAHSPGARVQLQSFTEVHRDNMDEALQNVGPLVVALDASQPTFHFYKSGIYHETNCSEDAYNLHALLVGLSQPEGAPAGQQQVPRALDQPHYLIRTALGPDWGDAGHMRLAKDASRNKCLPQQMAIYPNVIIE